MPSTRVELPSPLTRHRPEIEAALREALTSGSPDLLYRMMQYHMGWLDAGGAPTSGAGGKAVRPALCLLACEAVGGDWRPALPAATALELAHNFSLIHDDIQDGDRERRHRPTVWSLWGQPQAINAGDSMLTLAHLALGRLRETGVNSQRVLAAFRALDGACLGIIEGQCLDLAFEGSLEIDIDAYLEMVGKKTGTLFEAALRLGALAGGADDMVVERLGRCGHYLGLVFQTRDDMLGIWGEEEATGKPVAADIRRRKKTLPVVYALQAASGADRRHLVAIYSRETIGDEEAQMVLGYLKRLEAEAFCQKMVEEHCQRALAELEGVKLVAGAQGQFQEVCAFLSGRQF